jgi:hypothetical protein
MAFYNICKELNASADEILELNKEKNQWKNLKSYLMKW